jgi:chromosome segregation ATPase
MPEGMGLSVNDSGGELSELRAQLLDLRRSLDAATRRLVAAEESLATREKELDVAQAENCKRRTAMTEMSAELERRRARAYRAEALVADLQQRIVKLEARERADRLADRYRIRFSTPEVYEALRAVRQRERLRRPLVAVTVVAYRIVSTLRGRLKRLVRRDASPPAR